MLRSSLIDAHLSSMNYDANKLPLGKYHYSLKFLSHLHELLIGKLAKSTILNGFSALKVLPKHGNIRNPSTHMSASLFPKSLLIPLVLWRPNTGVTLRRVRNSPTHTIRASHFVGILIFAFGVDPCLAVSFLMPLGGVGP